MSNKAKKHGKSRKNIWILVSVVAIFVVILSAFAYNNSQHPKPVQDASRYFAISDLAGLYKNAGSTNQTILITQFDFTFTPILGDATNVRIFINQVDPATTDWEGSTIRNGTATSASAHTATGTIMPTNSLRTTRQNDGTYPLTITILSVEAQGNVTLHFTPDNLVQSG